MSNMFEKRIGNTIYVVSVQPSATAKKTLDEIIRELCRKEVESPDFGLENEKLEGLKKIS